MTTRVYVPSTTGRLRELLVSGGLGPAPLLAHAVTQELRDALREVGEEEWEYDALMSAAQDSLGLIGDGDRPLRVVVVAEAGTVTPQGEGEESLVEVESVIPLAKVAAVHMDSPDATDAVVAARDAWAAARDGDADAQEVLDACLDHELGWYATQEIKNLVDEG